ncbi:hypothetical protein H0G86_005813 [Trichoderma simmonsii]|uniref:NDT80 domain-containing protein n=1 Tax=Trichoderma simmonsii TaxID=1491479 RepID=A0A8G0LEY6_9HYPO|nr:hypothetical protein H0G86_005813 [Trichoderma simmonsii]
MANEPDEERSQHNHSMQELSRIDDAHRSLLFVESPTSSDPSAQLGSIIVTAQLSGTFLKGPQAGQGARGHICCYRRNLFHIRGTIVLVRSLTQFPDNIAGDIQPSKIHATLTATESVNGEEVAIITVTKTTRDTTTPPGHAAPPPIDIDVDTRHDCTPLVFAWPRLQFRSATAKRGRRKEKGPDQHFTLHIRFFAVFPDGSKTLLSEQLSAPIAVRGRSPSKFTAMRAFQDGQEHLVYDIEPNLPSVRESPIALPMESSEQEESTPSSTFVGGNLANEDNALFNVTVFEPRSDNRDVGHVDFLLTGDFGIPEGIIRGFSPYLNLEGDDILNLTMPDVPPNGESMQASHTLASLLAAASDSMTPEPLSDHVQPRQETWIESQTAQPLVDAVKKSFHYEYIPLSMDDRTPPVQAIYVGGSLLVQVPMLTLLQQPHRVHHKITLPKTMQGNKKRYFGELSD